MTTYHILRHELDGNFSVQDIRWDIKEAKKALAYWHNHDKNKYSYSIARFIGSPVWGVPWEGKVK